MTTEETALQQREEYEFVFTRAELDLIGDANAKPMRRFMIVMGVGFLVAIVLLWADILVGLGCGVLLGMTAYAFLFFWAYHKSYKKAYLESTEPVLRCRYHYCVHEDHAMLTVYQDQTLYALRRIDYRELKAVRDHGTHYSFTFDQGGYLIPKAALKPDSPFGAALREKVAPKKPQGKLWHVLANVSLWAAILGSLAALSITARMPSLGDDYLGQVKVLLVALLLPILSIVMGIALRKKGVKWLRNVIAGAITAVLLLFLVGMTLIGGVLDRINASYQPDTDYLEQTEKFLGVDFPEPVSASDYEYDAQTGTMINGQMLYSCYYWFAEEDATGYFAQFEEDPRWSTRPETMLLGLMPREAFLNQGDWMLLYNMDLKEYNAVPAEPGVYRFLCVVCDTYGCLSIYEYETEYIP